jgi:hypothetical protein
VVHHAGKSSEEKDKGKHKGDGEVSESSDESGAAGVDICAVEHAGQRLPLPMTHYGGLF